MKTGPKSACGTEVRCVVCVVVRRDPVPHRGHRDITVAARVERRVTDREDGEGVGCNEPWIEVNGREGGAEHLVADGEPLIGGVQIRSDLLALRAAIRHQATGGPRRSSVG